MPRRRMIDPEFWDNTEVAKLTRDERLLLLGCLNNADDDGRLKAHPAYLKAAIFMYDNDPDPTRIDKLKQSMLKKMANWRKDNPWCLQPYQNSGENYLHFPSWFEHQKPSHPAKSKLPAPPIELSRATHPSGQKETRPTPAAHQKESRATPSQSSLGQSSQGEVSIGQVSAVQEDFTKFLDSEKDLTDFLTKTLEKYLPRGPSWLVGVLNKLWEQALGKSMKDPEFTLTLDAVRKYPSAVLARAYVKAIKYSEGKHSPARYLDKILKEKMEKESQGGTRPCTRATGQ